MIAIAGGKKKWEKLKKKKYKNKGANMEKLKNSVEKLVVEELESANKIWQQRTIVKICNSY